jgi:hypothetical protein
MLTGFGQTSDRSKGKGMGNLEMSQTSIHDHGKFAVWMIVAPYLIDVKSYLQSM